MDIRQLTYFIAIAEEGNITKAAERLHIAQPHLSQQLKLMEDELNVKLIERNTRKFQITDAGQRLWHRSKQMIELMESTVKELKDFNEGLEGTLSIGIISSSGNIIFPKRICNFNRKYPNINFEIRECSTNEILELLKSGVIEIGIIRTPLNSEVYESISLPIEPMVAATSNNYHWDNKRKNIYLRELVDKPLLVHRRYEKMILGLCTQEGFKPRILCKIEDTRSILLLANAGMGIAIVPKDWVELIPNMNLSYKIINEPTLNTSTTIVWMKGHYLSSAAKHFLETFQG